MATQNLSIHQSFTSEGSFTIINENERTKKKAEKELLALAVVLKELELELAGAKKGAQIVQGEKIVSLQTSDPDAVNASDDSTGPFQKAMAEMVLALQLLLVKISEFRKDKADLDNTVNKAEIKALEDNIQKVIKDIKTLEAKEAKEKRIALLEHIAEFAVASIISVLACAFGQVGVAILVMGMAIASYEGVFQKLTDDVAKGLETIPILAKNPKIAQIIATIIVLIIVFIATAAIAPSTAAAEVGNAAARTSSAAIDAEEEGEAIEMTEMGASKTTDPYTLSVEETKTVSKVGLGTQVIDVIKRAGDSLKSAYNKINLFNKLGSRANLAITNSAQVLSQIDFGKTLADAIARYGHLSKKEKENLEIGLRIAMEIITLIVALGAGTAMATNGANTIKEVDGTTILGRILNRIKATLSSTKGLIATETVRQSISAAATALEMWCGYITMQEGYLNIALAKEKAFSDLILNAMNQENEIIASSQKQDASILKEQKSDNQSISHLMDGEKAFARLFTAQQV